MKNKIITLMLRKKNIICLATPPKKIRGPREQAWTCTKKTLYLDK